MSGEGMLGAGDRSTRAIARRGLLGEAVRQWRAGASLTVREASLRLGVTPAWIEDAERKRIDPMAIGPSTATRVLREMALAAHEIGLEPAEGDPQPPGTSVAGAAGEGSTGSPAVPVPAGPGGPSEPTSYEKWLPIVQLRPDALDKVMLRLRHVAFSLTPDQAEVLGRQLIAHAALARA